MQSNYIYDFLGNFGIGGSLLGIWSKAFSMKPNGVLGKSKSNAYRSTSSSTRTNSGNFSLSLKILSLIHSLRSLFA